MWRRLLGNLWQEHKGDLMKKMTFALILILLASAGGYCATNQPNNIGTVSVDGIGLPSKTLAQMNALTSDTTGQMLYVSDAVQSRVCVSSGTVNPGAWVVGVATGAFTAATYPHCQ